MAMAKVLVLDPEEADFVRRTAAEHDVTLDEVPAAGIEPVLTLTVVMIGTATAVAAVNDLVERRRGGQVIDLRPGATRVFFRSPDLIYGLVVVWAADGGAVYVEVKEPKGMFGQIVESLIGLLGDLAGAKSDAVAAAVAASLGPAVSVTNDGGAG
jgi:hypothetical protein